MAKTPTRADSALISPDLTTSSLIVAEKFGKRHDNVVQKIEALDIPESYRLLNFQETVIERPNPSGGAPIRSKAYQLTRDGFALLVMGFTGKRAMAWKIRFLEAFNEMERQLTGTRPATRAVAKRPSEAASAGPLPPETITWALTRPISAKLRIVLAELARRASPGVTCSVPLDRLAMARGLHRRTVTLYLDTLEAMGLLRRTGGEGFVLLMPHAPTGAAPALPGHMGMLSAQPDDRPLTWRQMRLILHDAAMGFPPDPAIERLFNLFCRYQEGDWRKP